MADKIGKAYAFFDCNASKGDIEEELPFIRECVHTPNELELMFMEGIDSLTSDLELLQIVGESNEVNMRYVMEAKYPNNSNEKTAEELSAILNQVYQSFLSQKREQFRGTIFYKREIMCD
ncbi:MAG: hypothetical protein NUV97_00065 [archaeon]|nr:hypothetical protein [archaeon]MCR4323388.1 hypothetical protein [Nanoarchaeota archaeon]